MIGTAHLSWAELARRTGREAIDDDVAGLAAQLSYYFFLALFPAILFLLALASFFPLSNITDEVSRALGPFLSSQVLELIQQQMRRLANNQNGGLLTFGVAGALWSSSAALVSIVGALNRAYDIEEGRPWWRVRLIAIGLTFGVALWSASTALSGLARNFWHLFLCRALVGVGEAGYGPASQAIIAEYFGGPQDVLGQYIVNRAQLFQFPDAWAAILVASILGVTFYLLILLAERRVMPWHVSFRRED